MSNRRFIESRRYDTSFEISLTEVVDLSTDPYIRKKKILFEKFYKCLFIGEDVACELERLQCLKAYNSHTFSVIMGSDSTSTMEIEEETN
jgi:hypothetical protein